MVYQWGRFMWWLAQGQNAGAVQAVSSVVVVVLTVALILVTARYVRLTGKSLALSSRHFSAIFQPRFKFETNAWI
jgi:hypothetical protein